MSPFLVVWLLCATGIVGIALLVFEKRSRRPGRNYSCFPLTIVALLVWIFAYAAELAAEVPQWMLLWANIQFIGIGSVPFLLYATIRQFLGRKPIPRWKTAVSAFIPVMTVVLAFTDQRFSFLRSGMTVVEEYGAVQLDVRYGLWHNAVFVTYQYGFYLATVVHLLHAALKSPRIFRARIYWLAAAMMIPMAGGMLYVLDLPPFNIFNPVSVLLMTSFVIFGISMFRHHVRDVIPVAVDQVLDTLDEGIIVLDQDDTIVEYNTAAASLFAELSPLALGRNLVESFGKDSGILTLIRDKAVSETSFRLPGPMGLLECRGRSRPVIGVDGSRIGRLLTIFHSELISDDRRDDESEHEQRTLLICRDFFTEVDNSLAVFRDRQQDFHLAAIIFGDIKSIDTFRNAVSTVVSLVKTPERICFNGDGRFFLSLPGQSREEALLRARTLIRGLESRGLIARFGITGCTGNADNSVEELAARALHAVLNSRQAVNFSNI